MASSCRGGSRLGKELVSRQRIERITETKEHRRGCSCSRWRCRWWYTDTGGRGNGDGACAPCAVPALNYWDATRSMSQKESGRAAWNDGLSRHSYIMHEAASTSCELRVFVGWYTKKKEKKKKESAVYPPCLRAFSPASFLSWLRWTLVQVTRWEEDKNGGEVRCYEGLCLFYTLSGWGERTRERQVIVQIIISHYHCVTIVHLVHLHRYR